VTVFLLRHGIAAPASDGQPDESRKLTEEGRRGLKRLFRVANIKPDLVLVSPYLRARETAALAIDELKLDAPCVESGELTPESSPKALWDEVRIHGADTVLVVSHEPLLSSTAAWALGSTRDLVQFPPGGLMGLDLSSTGAAPIGLLRWMMTPESVA
jgi:phosphohistidine phosphatase